MSKMLFFAQNRRMGPPPQFSVQPTSLSFGYSSSSKQLTVNSNYPWTYVSGETSWCTIDTKSGDGEGADTINVSVTENTSASQTRSATLLFRNEKGLEARVRVSQAVHESYTLSVSPSSVTLQKDSGSQATITISANQGWSISGVPSWASVSKNSGSGSDTVTITASSTNTSTDERNAVITVTGNISGSDGVTVRQLATPIVWSVSPQSISLDADDTSEHTINVTSNTSWTITGYPDWVEVSTTSGSGSSSVTVNAKSEYTGDSQRSGTITFRNTHGQTQTVSISQSAATITYSDVTVHMSYEEDINAAGSNSVTPVVTYSQTWGYNGSTTGGGTITTGGSLSFEKTSGNRTVDTSNGTVSASSKGTTVSGRTEAATVKVTVSMNGKQGTATATCYQGENKVERTTIARGESLDVNASDVILEAEAPSISSTSITASRTDTETTHYTSGATTDDTDTVSITANGESTSFGSHDSWFSIGFDSPTATICAVTAASSNTSTSSRSDTVTITVEDEYGNSGSASITVTQKGAENYLNVSPQILSFEAKGGTKEITIDTNESWTIS